MERILLTTDEKVIEVFRLTNKIPSNNCMISDGFYSVFWEKNSVKTFGNDIIAFSGSIYNRDELLKSVLVKTKDTQNISDIDLFYFLLKEMGEKCFNYINGQWAFIYFNSSKKEVKFGCDRFAVKKMYYAVHNDNIYISYSIKDILSLSLFKPKANRKLLEAYIGEGIYAFTEDTMITGINRILGGTCATYSLNNNCLKINEWYKVPRKINNNSFEENAAIFRELFDDAIKIRMNTEIIGASLSGGLDSSTIVCAANEICKFNNTNIRTFTSCFDDNTYDESEFADLVIKKTGLVGHKVFPDLNRVFDEIDDMLVGFGEPFGSMSCFAHNCLLKTIKEEGIDIMLDGQGADEQLAGYSSFYRVLFSNLAKKMDFKTLHREIAAYNSDCDDILSSFGFNEVLKLFIKNYLPNSILSYIKKKKLIEYYNNDCVIKHLGENSIVTNFKLGFNEQDSVQYSYQYLKNGMSAEFNNESCNASLCDIEIRFPFLDYRIVEHLSGVPIEQKICLGYRKSIMREAYKDVLPEEIRLRKTKLGFATPENIWLRDNKKLVEREFYKAVEVLEPILDVDYTYRWFEEKIINLDIGDFSVWRIICAGRWALMYDIEI